MSRQSQQLSPPPQQQEEQQQQEQQEHQQASPLDPRLMPSSGGTSVFKTEDSASLYQRPSQPLAYPMPLSTTAQTRVYSDSRPNDPIHAQAQPYYGLQTGRSPSDELQESIESDRRQSGLAAFANQSPNGDSQDQKRSRACEACRGLKVRCDMDLTNPAEPCRRCKKAGRHCVVTQPTRRRQKKSDTRVAELERKIEALSAVLHQQQNNAFHPVHPVHADQAATAQQSAPESAYHEHGLSTSTSTPLQTNPARLDYPHPELERSNKRRRVESTSEPTQNQPFTLQYGQTDVVKTAEEQYYQGALALRHELMVLFPSKIRNKIRDLVEPDLMRRIFEYFVTVQTPNFPIVVFTPGTTAEDVLEDKPVLMLAILFIGCTFMVSPELRQTIFDEIMLVISEAVIQKALKTLELVQALQVVAVFQKQVDQIRRGSFYTMIHLASVMALDLGLGKRYNAAKSKRGFGGPGSEFPPGPGGQLPLIDSDSIEARRAWLVCYYLCACAAQVLRRPNLLRWTGYMQQCVELLETSPYAEPSDKTLVQHVKVQHICEEINTSFALDDPDATSISITDPKVAYTLNVLQSQVRDWEAKIPDDLRVPQLTFFAHCTTLYLHEIALHVNHNTDDFRLPFTEASLKSGSEQGFAATLTQNQMTSIEACLKASHAVIDVFCSLDLDTHVVLPPLPYFVRIVYALIVLIKLHIAVVSPGSELGKLIRPDDVQAQVYLNKLWELFSALAVKDCWTQHNKAQQIVGLLRDWVGTHQHGDGTKETGGGETSAPPNQKARANSDDNLRLLSEAATNATQQHQQQQQQQQQQSGGTTWTSGLDSQAGLPYPSPYSMSGPQQHGGGNSVGSASTTVMGTPQTQTQTGFGSEEGSSSSYGIYGQQQSQQQGQQAQQAQQQQQDNTSSGIGGGSGMPMTAVPDCWTAHMDFEQAVNVALQDLDFSGDLFGSFYGNGADAFQIPGEGVANYCYNGAQQQGGGVQPVYQVQQVGSKASSQQASKLSR